MATSTKRQLHGLYGASATITPQRDGTARLVIRQNGRKMHDKIHKNERAALAAWYRYTN